MVVLAALAVFAAFDVIGYKDTPFLLGRNSSLFLHSQRDLYYSRGTRGGGPFVNSSGPSVGGYASGTAGDWGGSTGGFPAQALHAPWVAGRENVTGWNMPLLQYPQLAQRLLKNSGPLFSALHSEISRFGTLMANECGTRNFA
ncbi:MAG: hypothetical protein DMG68_15070 [Acidobacteria bacterium]|nr:MAG: hypothetical protein DMG68_15070 [Acidobacteriota bacterium]